MAVREGSGKTVIKNVRDVNNFIRRQIVSGKDIGSAEGRDEVIKEFLAKSTTTTGAMTPELFAFFLQKLNTHALFEQLDNDNYSIVFPAYIPFDVEAVAAGYGFKDLYRTIEDNLKRRAASAGSVKTASAAMKELGGADYIDKVASSNSTGTDEAAFSDLRDSLHSDKLSAARLKKLEAAEAYQKYSNMDDFVKTAMFSSNRDYVKLLKEIKGVNAILASRDKTATLADFNRFTDLLDDLIAIEKK